MNHSTIYVQFKDGSKPKGMKVTISISGGGVSKPAFTDRDGLAIVEHASVGRARVYVRGRDMGSFRAPGKFAVTID